MNSSLTSKPTFFPLAPSTLWWILTINLHFIWSTHIGRKEEERLYEINIFEITVQNVCESLLQAGLLTPSVETHILAVHVPIMTVEHRHRLQDGYKKTQHYGKQLPHQTYQVLTLFWGDQIRVHPKKWDKYICEHMNYLIFQAKVQSRHLILRSLNTTISVHHLLLKSSNLIASLHIQMLFKAKQTSHVNQLKHFNYSQLVPAVL